MNTKKNFLLANILAPLIIGAVIYYLISPDVIFVEKIDSCIGHSFHLSNMKTDSRIFRFIRNYLLDMLWGYALIFVLFLIFDNKTAELMKILIISLGFSAIMEILQLTTFVVGTFDILDIIVEFLAELIAVFIIKSKCVRGGTIYEKKI